MTVSEKILALTKRLYPKGRAFNIRVNSYRERLHKALNESETKAYSDALSILDSILPDNNNFTIEDAQRWEQRLGMIDGSNTSLANRKLAIARKMNHPGTIPARQSADYLEMQLQDAGFDVYVYRSEGLNINQFLSSNNANNNIAQLGGANLGSFNLGSIQSIFGSQFRSANLGGFNLGSTQLGGTWYGNNVINSIDENKDAIISIQSDYHYVFYIGGATAGTFANVDVTRKEEFRQLILKLKPVNSVGQLLINYV